MNTDDGMIRGTDGRPSKALAPALHVTAIVQSTPHHAEQHKGQENTQEPRINDPHQHHSVQGGTAGGVNGRNCPGTRPGGRQAGISSSNRFPGNTRIQPLQVQPDAVFESGEFTPVTRGPQVANIRLGKMLIAGNKVLGKIDVFNSTGPVPANDEFR